MIICSTSLDVLTRRALGKETVSVGTISNIINVLALDPSIEEPKRELFIIGEQDIMKPKVRLQFLEAVSKKHPAVKVLIIARAKSDLKEGKGINKVITTTDPDKLSEVVAELVESKIVARKEVHGSDVEAPTAYVPVEFKTTAPEKVSTEAPHESAVEELKKEDTILPKVEERVREEEEEVYTEEEAWNRIVERVRQCHTIADVAILTREITATGVVKDVLRENQEYATMEEQLNSLKQKIHSVMLDPAIPSIEEKWTKIRALSNNKAFYAAKTSNILAQRIDEIIGILSSKTRELLNERMADIDKVISGYRSGRMSQIEPARISGLMDKRARLIADAAALQKEVFTTFSETDNMITNAIEDVIKENTSTTGIPVVDDNLRARGEAITSEDGLQIIQHMLMTAVNNSDDYMKYQNTIEVLNRKIALIINVDDEIIAAQNAALEYLTAKDVEDMVSAHTLIKRAMRLYVGEEGVGRTAISYIISKGRSKMNANVLYVDLTGQSKLKDYGESAIDVFEWIGEGTEKPFCAVEGNIDDINTASFIQRVSNALVKAADYYRVINVVLRPDQTEIISALQPDTLSINYITDIANKSLEKMREVIKNTAYENMAQKVIVNKCNRCAEVIVQKLGLSDRIDVSYVQIPYIPQIADCALQGVNPAEVDIVEKAIKEVMKHA